MTLSDCELKATECTIPPAQVHGAQRVTAGSLRPWPAAYKELQTSRRLDRAARGEEEGAAAAMFNPPETRQRRVTRQLWPPELRLMDMKRELRVRANILANNVKF